MTAEERDAIAAVLKDIGRWTRDGYHYVDKIRDWLNRLDPDALSVAREYFEQDAAAGSSIAINVLSWKGWPDREEIGNRLYRLLSNNLFFKEELRDEVLSALLRLGYRPAMPAYLERLSRYQNADPPNCAWLMYSLAFVDEDLSIEETVKMFSRAKSAGVNVSWRWRWIFYWYVATYLDIQPHLLISLAERMWVKDSSLDNALVESFRAELSTGRWARDRADLVLKILDERWPGRSLPWPEVEKMWRDAIPADT
jgi:hypothetical protein